MSVQNEITRIVNAVADAYDAVDEMGGTLPANEVVGNLADAILTIPKGGGGSAISVVDTQDSHGGTIRTITAVDISDTTAVASDVASGKYFYTAQGVKTQGAAGGGATQHTIHIEFSDGTDTDIEVDYDDSFVGSLITETKPKTYGQKSITLAQLDNVTWYEPVIIPLNTELIDYTECTQGYYIGDDGDVYENEWIWVSDYTAVDSSMTFSYTASYWYYIGLYDDSHNFLRSIYVYSDGTVDQSDGNTGHGTLSGNKLPRDVAYVRLCGTAANSSKMSLIRTA